MGSLAHHRSLDFACVGLIWANFEHRLMLDFKKIRMLSLHWQSLPSAISGAHIFNVVSALHDTDSGMDIAQVLIILEMNQVIRLSPNSHFSFVGYLDNSSMGWAFDNGKCQDTSNHASLKLVAAHLDNHILHTSKNTW